MVAFGIEARSSSTAFSRRLLRPSMADNPRRVCMSILPANLVQTIRAILTRAATPLVQRFVYSTQNLYFSADMAAKAPHSKDGNG